MMPLTTNDLYRAAAKGETSWEHALLLTGLLYVEAAGIKVSPPPENGIDSLFYKLRLDALREYPNNNPNYKNVMKSLHSYVAMLIY